MVLRTKFVLEQEALEKAYALYLLVVLFGIFHSWDDLEWAFLLNASFVTAYQIADESRCWATGREPRGSLRFLEDWGHHER